MVRYQYDRLDQDENDALSRGSLDCSGPFVGDAGREVHLRTVDDGSRIAHAIAPSPGTLHDDAGAPIPHDPRQHETSRPNQPSTDVVGWKDLPKKGQLLVITLARLSEPLTQTSLQVCMHILANNSAPPLIFSSRR